MNIFLTTVLLLSCFCSRGLCNSERTCLNRCYPGTEHDSNCYCRVCVNPVQTYNPRTRRCGPCTDSHGGCRGWASGGWCKKSNWMVQNCKKSCKLCSGGGRGYGIKIRISSIHYIMGSEWSGMSWAIHGSRDHISGHHSNPNQDPARDFIQPNVPGEKDLGKLHMLTLQLDGPYGFLLAEWADVYDYRQKVVYRFALTSIDSSQGIVQFRNPTERVLCQNQCNEGVTSHHPECDCTVCENPDQVFQPSTKRCGYAYALKIKPSSCPESRVNNMLNITIYGDGNKVHHESVTRPNTRELIVFNFFSLSYISRISYMQIELVDSGDWLEAEWADVYDYIGVIYRFTLKRITGGRRGPLTFINPSSRPLHGHSSSFASPPPAVVMCHFHKQYEMRGPRKTVLNIWYRTIYPCTHVVFGKLVIRDSKLAGLSQTSEEELWQLVHLKSTNPKTKVLLSVKVNSFQFDLTDVVESICTELVKQANWNTRPLVFDGVEIDTSRSEFHEIADRLAFAELLKALRKGMDRKAKLKGLKDFELSVVVNSNLTLGSRNLYDIDSLSLYADYVVVNAVVDKWPNHSPYDTSTVSPSSLFKANTGGESQCQSVARWVRAGLPKEKIILPYTTFAWNTPYCVIRHMPRSGCLEYYSRAGVVPQFSSINEPTDVYKVPFYYVNQMGHQPWMDSWPWVWMQKGPGVPYENQQTVLERMKYLKFEGLRGTKVIDIMWEPRQCPLTWIAYRELVGAGSNSSKTQASSNKNSGPCAGTGGMSGVLVITIICVHLFAGL